MESKTKIVRRYTLGFRAFMLLFWSSMAFYSAIELPKAWFDTSYSRIGLAILTIPFIFLIIVGMLFPILERVIITDDLVEVKSLTLKKIYFNRLTKVELGPNFLELYSGKKKITLSWLYEDYEEIKFLILEKAKSLSEINITHRKKYKKS